MSFGKLLSQLSTTTQSNTNNSTMSDEEFAKFAQEYGDYGRRKGGIIAEHGGVINTADLEYELANGTPNRTADEKANIFREGAALRAEIEASYRLDQARKTQSIGGYEKAISTFQKVAKNSKEEAVRAKNEKLIYSLKVGGGVAVFFVIAFLIYYLVK